MSNLPFLAILLLVLKAHLNRFIPLVYPSIKILIGWYKITLFSDIPEQFKFEQTTFS